MKDAPILSTDWYRVAGLQPRLLDRVRLHRHHYRGELWYLLQDPATGRVHRYTPAARLLIAGMNGRRTVQDLWALANRHLGEDAPTQDEVIRLLGQLHAGDLLQAGVSPDVAELLERGERTKRQKRMQSFVNPMAIRIPLWDPDALLNRFAALCRLLWSRWGALLWLAVVLPALLLLPPHWHDLTHNLSDRVLQVDNLLALWIVFPLIKACHEMGHASAVKAGGGEVHDMGLMLLVLMPVPYVDASASTVFRSKLQRMLVGAAGMAVELFIAALAFYAWLMLEPGLARSLAFNVMLVAGVSTVLFNGNPLLRYDAYYILADWRELPNLAKRTADHWAWLAKHHVLGLRDLEEPVATAGERAWFVFYGLASLAYRLFLTVVIALFIAGQFFFIGVVLALWAIVAMIGVPVFKILRFLFTNAQVRLQRQRALAVCVGGGGALLLALTLWPVPFRSQAEGVVWLGEQGMVRAQADGFVDEPLVADGAPVIVGTPLIRSVDPALSAQIRLAEAEVAELEAQYANEFVSNRANAAIVAQRLAGARATLARNHDRAAGLIVVAGAQGTFRMPHAQDQVGRYVRNGDILAHVVGATPPLARVVVPQADVDVVGVVIDRVQLRLAGSPDRTIAGRVLRQVPAGDHALPSKALAIDGGGQLALDPREASGLHTLERTFQLDIEMVGMTAPVRFGERVYVRFEHQPTPLAVQGYRAVRRLFLTQFNV